MRAGRAILSSMPSLDDEIDHLYQLPTGDFTAARNALAKRAGVRAADIRRLTKPNPAAWAVNQVYWHRRPVFGALVKASEARRAAHVHQLRGEGTDPAVADARHRAALDTAFDQAVAFLRHAGDALAPPTLEAITRTLEAVPSDEIQGRLTRPVDPVGFSMLASLMGTGPAPARRSPADVVVMPRRGTTKAEVDVDGAGATPSRAREQQQKADQAARRAREAVTRERERLRKELTAAQAAERRLGDALTAARRAVERAGSRIDRLERHLSEARRALANHHEAADLARTAVNDAAAARVVIERRLQDLES
jgi:hypothetical protein